jgi:hypothetical protein
MVDVPGRVVGGGWRVNRIAVRAGLMKRAGDLYESG